MVRFCRAVGLRGYPELRLALAAAVAHGDASPVAAVSHDINPGDDAALIAKKIAYADAMAVTETANHLDVSVLVNIVSALAAARAHRHLRRGGQRLRVARPAAEAPAHRPPGVRVAGSAHGDHVRFAARSGGDVAVGLSHTGTTVDTIDALREARRNGAITVAVTNFPWSPITEAANFVLLTAARETAFRSGAMTSRIAQLTVVDCLFVVLAQRDLPATEAALERTFAAAQAKRTRRARRHRRPPAPRRRAPLTGRRALTVHALAGGGGGRFSTLPVRAPRFSASARGSRVTSMRVSSASAQLVTDPTPPEPAPAPAKGRRLAWLDALRGFAALCVVFDHMSTLVLQHVRSDLYVWFNGGQYGVFVFFLVSGYIIPASLERKGSVRGFWVSRGFRLYPLYILGIAVSLLAWKTGFGPIHGADTQPKTWIYSLPFMMSNMIDGANVPNVIWTLSFEMVFYLLLSALFTFRVHRHSGGYALTAAIGAVVLGGILPIQGLSHTLGSRRVAVIAADILLFIGLALAVSGRRVPRRVGGALAAVTGLTLLLFNTSYPYNWSGLTILALMFTGTMLYRAEQGEFRKRKAAVIAVLVFALAIAAGVWHSTMWHMYAAYQRQFDLQWISCLVLAGATFAIGMALRHRTVPRVLAWLGLVSYSVYMLHPIVLNAYRTVQVFDRPHPFAIQVLLAAGILVVVLASAALSYYFVEAPMQRVGHRFARMLQARFGSDAITDSVAVPDAPAVTAGDPLLDGTPGLPDPAHEGPAEAHRHDRAEQTATSTGEQRGHEDRGYEDRGYEQAVSRDARHSS